jgi:hypothetical protein
VIADFLERTAVEMNFRPRQLEAGLLHGFTDVANADGAEEFSFLADLAQDLQGTPVIRAARACASTASAWATSGALRQQRGSLRWQ